MEKISFFVEISKIKENLVKIWYNLLWFLKIIEKELQKKTWKR
jgi:hypothetical protein